MVDDLLGLNLLHDVPNGHANIAFTILAGVCLRRFTPSALPQHRDAGEAIAILGLWRTHNAGDGAHRLRRIRSAQ